MSHGGGVRGGQASQTMEGSGAGRRGAVVWQGPQSLGNLSAALGKAVFTLVTAAEGPQLGADTARPELMEKK